MLACGAPSADMPRGGGDSYPVMNRRSGKPSPLSKERRSSNEAVVRNAMRYACSRVHSERVHVSRTRRAQWFEALNARLRRSLGRHVTWLRCCVSESRVSMSHCDGTQVAMPRRSTTPKRNEETLASGTHFLVAGPQHYVSWGFWGVCSVRADVIVKPDAMSDVIE